MFIKFSSHLVLLFSIFQVAISERRIVDGNITTADKRYAVYFVKAKDSAKTYDTWLCGGAIVTKWFIITSAACVEDVQFMYAIAGYRKYVTDRNIDKDHCTKKKKKKIVYRCVPLSYEFDFKQVEKWAYVDIALVKVESPYDFADASYEVVCSYIPGPISINYDEKRQATDVDAMVLGWGHEHYWRERNDDENYNTELLQFGSTTLYDKQKCAEEYSDYPELIKIIEKYMICTKEPGHINDHGLPYSMGNKKRIKKHICITKEMKKAGIPGEVCPPGIAPQQYKERASDGVLIARDGRKHTKVTEINNGTNFKDNGTDSDYRTDTDNGTYVANLKGSVSKANFNYKPGRGNVSGFINGAFTRRTGICQNDHGGPLVTWVGKREVLIGIASVFKISPTKHCIGPYLFTSTTCNGAFLGCVLGDQTYNFRSRNDSLRTSREEICNSAPSVRGFDTMESYVSWKDHPDGPADNEKSLLRSENKDTKNVEDDSDEPYVNLLNGKNTPQFIVPNYTPKTKEQNPQNRFSSNIGVPQKKPAARKRPLLRKRRPPISRPPSDKKPLPRMNARLDVKPPSIIRSPSYTSPPVHIELPSTIKSLPKIESQPLIRPPPNMDNPPNLMYSEEIKPSPILRPSVLRPLPIVKPFSINKSPFVRPVQKIGSPVFETVQDFNSAEELGKK
ncbi:hypothetical protein PYW08_009677 [Mythimna loreyi]|uniref:Uncharacterized protein n=1 Tax=Mythimna loreyi TaxID=667449 RepID=A0ACC2Q6Q9_9NEOP|nr:hypothetical protein PYW08_009677 [Mythimna loreyi]